MSKIHECIDAWKQCNYHARFITETCLLEIFTTAGLKKIHVNIKFSQTEEVEVANQIMEIIDCRRNEMLENYRFENIEVYCEREQVGKLRPSGSGTQLQNVLNSFPHWMHGKNKNIYGKVDVEVTFYMYLNAEEDDLNPNRICQATFYDLNTSDTLHVLREKIEHSFIIPQDYIIGQFWKDDRLFDDHMILGQTCIEINNHTVFSPLILL